MMDKYCAHCIAFYLRCHLASEERIVSLIVHLSCCHTVCVSAALVSAAKVMRRIQYSLVPFIGLQLALCYILPLNQ